MRESIGKTNGRYNTKNNTYGYNEKRRHIVRPNSILYHCNDKTRCQKFLDNKKFMIESKEDGIWLGNGMYFWDNLSNAKFWYRKKQQKHDELLIVQSNVYTDFLLDLTDLDVCNKMEQLWNKVYKENDEGGCQIKTGSHFFHFCIENPWSVNDPAFHRIRGHFYIFPQKSIPENGWRQNREASG